MSLLKTAAKGMAWTTISTVIRSVVSMLQVAILTRYLSKSDFGTVAIATLFIGFSQIFLDMGISIGIMHKKDISPDQYSSLFWLNIIMGVFLTLLLMAITPFVSIYYDDPSLVPVLMWLSTSMFFSAIGNQHRTVQQKKLRFNYISIVEIITSLLTITVATITCVMGMGIYSLVISTLFYSIFSNITFLCIGLKNDNNISFHFNFKETYPFLKIGVFSIGTQLLDYFSREMDIIIISTTLGKEALGVYTLCKKLILALYQAVNPILMKVMTPLLANIQNDVKRLQSVYYDIVETLAFVNFPIYSLIAIFSYGIICFIYGEEFADGAKSLALLSIYYGFLTTGNPVGALQTALGRTDSGFYWTICRIILCFVATMVGAMFSVEAIIICLLLVSLLSSPISWRITIQPLIGGKFWTFFMLSFRPFVYTILFSIVFYYFFSEMTNVLLCVGIGIIYMIIYCILFYFTQKQTYLYITLQRVLCKKFQEL